MYNSLAGKQSVEASKRSGITSDPNRADDEEYIVRLVGRVVTVSVETVKLVRALPAVVAEDGPAERAADSASAQVIDDAIPVHD